MKRLLSLKHLQAIFFSLTFIASFVVSKQYTDPFFIPKDYFFYFSSALFILMTCFTYYNKKYSTQLNFSWLDMMVVGFILFSFVRVIFTTGISVDNIKFLLFFINGLLYFLIKPFLFENDKKDKSLPVETIVNILLIISIFQVCWGFSQYLGVIPNLEGLFSIGGAFGNPGPYTNFLTPLLSFALAVFFFSKKKNKTLGLIASIAILVILPFTKARTAWIGAFIVIVYMADKRYMMLTRFLNFLKSAVIKTLVIAMLAIIVVLSGYYVYNLKKNSSSGRLFIWQVSSTMIKDKPMWGFGFDRFAAAHNDYQANYFKTHPNDSEKAALADGVNYAFNEFIQVAVETGIVGLALLAFLFIFALWPNKEKSEPEEENIYVYGAKGSIIAILISMLFSYPLHTVPSLSLLFFSMAVVSAKNKHGILFSLKLNPKTLKVITVLGIASIMAFSVIQLNRNKAEHEWCKAFRMVHNNQIEDGFKLYKELYPTLTYNQFFLFNYGAELCLMKKYDESIEILKQVEPRLNDSDFYSFLAEDYENKGNLAAAEQCYSKSAFIMPLKFYPKYKLVEIYMKTGRKSQALDLAKSLLTMPVKIPSQTVTDIKQEMTQLLNSNKGL